jgi:hypothetical protein
MPELDLLVGVSDRCRLRASTPQKSGLRGVTLKLAIWFAFFLALAAVTPGHAEDYYFYEGPKGELVISNKEPPPGSQIIKRVPGATDKETPQRQDPAKTKPNGKTDNPAKPSTDK